MKKTHITYLRRLVNAAASFSGGSVVRQLAGNIRTPDTPVYGMIRDIVCDARFYTSLRNDMFWRNYGVYRVSEFIDSLSDLEWQDSEVSARRKEGFLSDWMIRHFEGLTSEEMEELSAIIFPEIPEKSIPSESEYAGESTEEYDETDPFTNQAPEFGTFRHASDRTNRTDVMSTKNLPKEIQDFIKDTKPSDGDSMESPHAAEARYLDSLDPALTALAREIGRCGDSSDIEPGKFRTATRSDINGIMTGNDLNAVLPSELALLADRATEVLFMRRYVERQLQIFSSASRSPEPGENDNGPVYICVDTSGSMSGTPERLAKSLALAVSIIAQSEHRPVCLLTYSDSVDYFLLTDYDAQRTRLLKFLAFSYSGGNQENYLFEFIFRYLPFHPGFRDANSKFKSADLLMISDFQWGGLSQRVRRYLGKAREEGMRVYSICIGMDEDELSDVYYQTKAMAAHADPYGEYGSGYRFLASSYSVNGYTEETGLVNIRSGSPIEHIQPLEHFDNA